VPANNDQEVVERKDLPTKSEGTKMFS